ncbi:MAG: hypothetical protein V4655_06990 [Bdellovibrionota bacterium]
MCIICLEFNKSRDFGDARLMIEAARREASAVPEEHLRTIEYALQKMKDDGEERELDPTADMDQVPA